MERGKIMQTITEIASWFVGDVREFTMQQHDLMICRRCNQEFSVFIEATRKFSITVFDQAGFG